MKYEWWVSWFQMFLILGAIDRGTPYFWVWFALAILVAIDGKWRAAHQLNPAQPESK